MHQINGHTSSPLPAARTPHRIYTTLITPTCYLSRLCSYRAMVALTHVQSSNSRIASDLPPGLVAVYVGATSGVGEISLKHFAKYARQPRVYFVGRSQDAGDRIAAECKALNSEGEFIFVKADTSLIRTVDDVCSDIKSKEKAVNLLFLSTGSLVSTKTSEGLHFGTALITYSRNRFIVNLLPLLQQATALRRVVTAFAAGKEGPVSINDFQGWKVSALSARGHASSLVTISLEALANKAPDVTFIHNFPGPVKSNLLRGGQGVAIFVLNIAFKAIAPMMTWYSNQECGERHLFLLTSARYVLFREYFLDRYRHLDRMTGFGSKMVFCLSKVSCSPGLSHSSGSANSKICAGTRLVRMRTQLLEYR